MSKEQKLPEAQAKPESEAEFDTLISDLLDQFFRQMRGHVENSLEDHLSEVRTNGDAICRMAAAVVEFAEGLTADRPDASPSDGTPLSKLLASIHSSAGQSRLASHLEQLPFPHYEPVPGVPDSIVRVEADGTRTTGRFVNRQFRADG